MKRYAEEDDEDAGGRLDYRKQFGWRPNVVWALLFAVAIIQTDSIVDGLHMSAVEVPAAVANGSQVTLICHYQLARGEQLYSVKWYKNYVEFYRFQPAGNSTTEDDPPQEQQWNSTPTQLKNEFELEGINLDLNKSNGTHVHLKQVGLASEANYKCEISADSPTFATISLERQMKVYVLPKQKLAILDNMPAGSSAAAAAATTTSTTTSDGQAQQAVAGAPTKGLVYQLNDLVNLTCLAGPSKPAAKLTWLVNEQPVSASSKWLTSQHIRLGDLVETRLTLAFKLQPNHLTRQPNINSNNNHHHHNHRLANGLYPIKLRCVAKLSVEFTSETAILVSGGKTLIKRRQQTNSETAGFLPQPSSLIESSGSQPEGDNAARHHLNNATNDVHYPIYRWPRPASSTSSSTSGGFTWTGSSVSPPGGSDAQLEQVRPTINRAGRQIMVWTSRQLRAQAEHIEQMLRKSHPNDVGPPLIEAKTLLNDDVEEPEEEGETTTTTISNDQESTTDNFGLIDETTTTTTTTPTEDPLATSDYDRRSSSSSSLIKDYELNEQVQFACTPQVGPSEQDMARSVHQKWLINDKEINMTQVNAFDGSKFYHEYRERKGLITTTTTTTSMPITTTTQSTDNLGSSLLTNGGHQPEIGHQQTKLLTIELTPSLFQLKELSLKCKTIVEQPLIEYESQVIASISTSPFIQVDQNHHHQQQAQNPSIRFRPSNRGDSYHKYANNRNNDSPLDNSGNNNNNSAIQRTRHKNNVYRLRQSASSSSAASRWPLVSCFHLTTALILALILRCK